MYIYIFIFHILCTIIHTACNIYTTYAHIYTHMLLFMLHILIYYRLLSSNDIVKLIPDEYLVIVVEHLT